MCGNKRLMAAITIAVAINKKRGVIILFVIFFLFDNYKNKFFLVKKEDQINRFKFVKFQHCIVL
jgi:hypothetical protein